MTEVKMHFYSFARDAVIHSMPFLLKSMNFFFIFNSFLLLFFEGVFFYGLFIFILSDFKIKLFKGILR